jgi:hypothetical protein
MSATILRFPTPPTGFPDASDKRQAVIWAAIEALEATAGAGCRIEEIAMRVGLEASEVARLVGDRDAVFAAAIRELAAWANV